jgi:hypothetical protein
MSNRVLVQCVQRLAPPEGQGYPGLSMLLTHSAPATTVRVQPPPKGQGMRNYLQTVYNGVKWNSPKSFAVEFMCTRWIEVVRKPTWRTSSLACDDCAFAWKHPTAALDGFPTTSITLLTENARSRNPNPKSEHL